MAHARSQHLASACLLRVVASMRNDVYLTHVLLAVHQLGGEEDGERATQDDGECSDESESDTGERLMATTVQNANCQCMAGAQGGCHHVCMLLQLVRLLQMSSRELMSHNPETPTGRACKWILNHCRGGRGASDKEWHFLPLWRMVDRLREVRDPKRQCLGLGQQKAASTRGVVAINRKSALNPHPDGGRWAESRKHFDEGVTISTKQADHVEEFIASLSELTLGTRGFVDSDMMATRVLPARVRSDSGEDSCQDSGESLRDDPDEETCDDSGEDSCGGSV